MTRTALALTAMLACGPAAAAPIDPGWPPIHDGLSGPAKAWGAAMEAGDLAALARMDGPATTSFPPDHVADKGGAAIMRGYAALFAKYTVHVAVADAHWIESGPLVVSWGLTTLTLHPKHGGPDVVSHTRFTDAAVAVEGGWRYVVDHASVPTKAP